MIGAARSGSLCLSEWTGRLSIRCDECREFQIDGLQPVRFNA